MRSLKTLEPRSKRKHRLYKVYCGSLTESGKLFPKIRLSGNYLEHFGFKIGDQVSARFSKGRIVLTKL